MSAAQMSAAQGLNKVSPLPPEEAVRADLYALLARLFAAGPDAAILAGIAGPAAPFGDSGALARAWAGLQVSAGAVDSDSAMLEHAETFVGTGRAPISIYASHYLSEQWKEMTVVELRDRLPLLGLARQAGVSQPEDHLAALLEVMCHLVRRGDDADAMAIQRDFFERYLGSWYQQFCATVLARQSPRFYCAAASVLEAFLAIEAEAFSLEI